MAQINYGDRTISCKIVYYGPGVSGKTTNLQEIFANSPVENKGKMVSLATEGDRTLYFDFLPLDLGEIKGFKTKFQLYTVPGQVYYNATRKLVLRGVDAVIFVADSQKDKMSENKESLDNLAENLKEMNIELVTDIPLVLQYNKRDLPDIFTVEEMHKELNSLGVPEFEAIAFKGIGIFKTLKSAAKLFITSFHKNYGFDVEIEEDEEPEEEINADISGLELDSEELETVNSEENKVQEPEKPEINLEDEISIDFEDSKTKKIDTEKDEELDLDSEIKPDEKLLDESIELDLTGEELEIESHVHEVDEVSENVEPDLDLELDFGVTESDSSSSVDDKNNEEKDMNFDDDLAKDIESLKRDANIDLDQKSDQKNMDKIETIDEKQKSATEKLRNSSMKKGALPKSKNGTVLFVTKKKQKKSFLNSIKRIFGRGE